MHLAVMALLFWAEVDQRCPGTALEQSPKLLSSLEPFQKAVRAADNDAERVQFRLTITEDGAVRDPEITNPASLSKVKEVMDRLRELKCCPAVRYSRYAAMEMRFDIAVK